MPAGCIFGHKGPAAFVDGDQPGDLLALIAITTSAPFRYLVDLQMAFGSYEVGVIQRTPVPDLNAAAKQQLSHLARSAWSAKRTLDTVNETSHAFILPAALRSRAGEYDPGALQTTLTRLQAAIDDAAFGLYGLDGDARAEIEAWATRTQKGGPAPDSSDDDADDEGEAEDVAAEDRDALTSWAVGVAFGRFDVRLATGERTAPPEPEPFDALPKRSAGMTPEDHPARAVLVDDPGHPLDLMAAVTAVLDQVELTLGAVPSPLRPWLAKNFFPLHIRMYSKSRRKAPIYWQLATPSGSYSVWLYLHALGADTLYRLHEDVLAPKVAFEQRRLDTLHADAGPSPTSAARKDIEDQSSFVDELQTLAQEVAAVAPLWRPNLDDGVLINFAPLWRAVPQNRAWQKELLATWKSLNAGDYDWSHLAMHLWPERVVPKCQSDRSLAIAHGLESVFWEPESDAPKARWRPRLSPTRPTEDLINERSSPAIKTALSHLDATRAAPTKPSRRRTGRGA